jgi:hypothetical protein
MFGPGFDSLQLHFFTYQIMLKARKRTVPGLFVFKKGLFFIGCLKYYFVWPVILLTKPLFLLVTQASCSFSINLMIVSSN